MTTMTDRVSHLFILFIKIGQLKAAEAKGALHLHTKHRQTGTSDKNRG